MMGGGGEERERKGEGGGAETDRLEETVQAVREKQRKFWKYAHTNWRSSSYLLRAVGQSWVGGHAMLVMLDSKLKSMATSPCLAPDLS